ncbi:hypothetical protein [Streptomyces sp. NPDC019937]|uniref:hypothetical protein n=1 Tax=Streptomyces sp. NPDC019937 TaxID=3154787 RepID=UPI0033F5E156
MIRTERPALWDEVAAVLHEPGFPLPTVRTAPAGEPVRGTAVEVPDLVLDAGPGGADPALGEGGPYASEERAGADAIRIRLAPGRSRPPAPIAAPDCAAPWFRRVYEATYLGGTTLAAAREADPGRTGRLDARLRYLVGMARYTAHYRDLPPVSGLPDLSRLPVLDMATLEECSLPRARDLTTDAPPSGGGLITTSSELTRMPVEAYSTGQQVTAELLLMLVRDFSANDGAQLGYQCSSLGGTSHHLNDDYNLVGVVDDDGLPVPEGESGHLLITAMQKFEGPLIRYRIGDVGRVSHRDCGCGVSGRVLEYLGRSDGQLKFKAQTVHYNELVDALEKFRGSQLQAELLTRGGTETLVLRTESPEPLDPGTLREFLIGAFPVLGHLQAYDDDLEVFELVVECHPEGALERNPVSGKIKTVIDRRLA